MWNAVKRPWQAITSNEKPKLDADDPLKNEKETQPDTPGNEYTSQQQHRPEEDENNKATVAQDSFIEGPRLVFLTIGLMALVLMVALDNYILATAIPRISTQFKSLDAIGWYASAYFLTQMAFQPQFGHLFSDFSVRAVALSAMAIFEVGSVICATAKTSTTLIAGRLIAGVGGAGLYVGTLTIITYAVPIRKRPFYLSLVTSMFGVASIAGPLLGGVFTDSESLTWRFCFWINLPIGFIAFMLTGLSFRPRSQSIPASKVSFKSTVLKLDVPGVAVLLGAFICFILALQWGGITYSWSTSRVWGCLVGFGLLSVTFLTLQAFRGQSASIPFHIATQRTVAAACIFLLFISMCVGILIYYLPLYFQAVRVDDAQTSAIHNLPFLVTMLFAPILSGALISLLIGFYVPFMWLGAILAVTGSSLLFTIRRTSSPASLSGYQFIVGLGLGLCTQLPFSAVQAVLPADQVVMGSSLVSFCNSLGPVLGTNIAQAIFANRLIYLLQSVPDIDAVAVVRNGPTSLGAAVPPSVRDAFDNALTRAFILPIACSSLAFCSSLAMQWVNIKKR